VVSPVDESFNAGLLPNGIRPEAGPPKEGQDDWLGLKTQGRTTRTMNVTDTSIAYAPASAAMPGAVQTAAAQSAAHNEGWAPPPITQDEMKTVCVCDTQPVTAEGIRTLLSDHQILRFDQGTDSLARAKDILRDSAPSVLMLDKAFGIQIVLEWLAEIRSTGPVDLTASTAIVIWGASITEARGARHPTQDCGDFSSFGVFAHGSSGAQLDGRIGFR
jgi:hypothetical protein